MMSCLETVIQHTDDASRFGNMSMEALEIIQNTRNNLAFCKLAKSGEERPNHIILMTSLTEGHDCLDLKGLDSRSFDSSHGLSTSLKTYKGWGLGIVHAHFDVK